MVNRSLNETHLCYDLGLMTFKPLIYNIWHKTCMPENRNDGRNTNASQLANPKPLIYNTWHKACMLKGAGMEMKDAIQMRLIIIYKTRNLLFIKGLGPGGMNYAAFGERKVTRFPPDPPPFFPHIPFFFYFLKNVINILGGKSL